MRFVAQFSNFSIQLIAAQYAHGAYGTHVLTEGVSAEFSATGWMQKDYETALSAFKFQGLQQYEDEATPVPPTGRIAVYDTEAEQQRLGWSDELRAEVERRLLAAKSFGYAYTLVPEVALDPPFPKYDAFTFDQPQELVANLDDFGFSLEDTLAYEESKWGQQREEVIAVLQKTISERSADEIVVE